MSRILVTGGLGYIGSHTVVELVKASYEVVIIDNLCNTSIDVLARLEDITQTPLTFYNVDVCDTAKLKAVLASEAIDGVIHFAAYKAVGESVEYPHKYYSNNVGGLISLLEALPAELPFVFSSSCTVYGDTKFSPITEDSPVVEAASPYGTSKIICEEILKDLSKVKPTSIVSLRYFNPVGAHESALIGELPIGVPNNLVPYITQTAAGIREKLVVFGGDYNTPDGTNVRDFIHVMDLAEAHVKALKYVLDSPVGYDVINLGTGVGNSVLDVINTFERANNIQLNYEIGSRRPGDVEQIWADASKAERILNWKASRTLGNMMETAWRWQQKLES